MLPRNPPRLLPGRGTGEAGGGAARSASFFYQVHDRLNTTKYLGGRKPKSFDPPLGEPGIAPRVTSRVRSHFVPHAVDLDAQSGLQAVEIQYVRTRGVLAAEFVPAGTGAKDAPKKHFGKRHRSPERFGSVYDGLPTRSHGFS